MPKPKKDEKIQVDLWKSIDMHENPSNYIEGGFSRKLVGLDFYLAEKLKSQSKLVAKALNENWITPQETVLMITTSNKDGDQFYDYMPFKKTAYKFIKKYQHTYIIYFKKNAKGYFEINLD